MDYSTNNCMNSMCGHMPENSGKSREKLMREIMEYDFVEYELVLYLDTHPHDMKALEMHSAITKKCLELHEEYEKRFGPLTTKSVKPKSGWTWIESPWPWETQREV